MSLIVSPLSQVGTVCAAHLPSHIVGLLSPGVEIPATDLPGIRHLHLRFHDIATPSDGLTPPDEAAIARLLRFAADWDADTPMLVYCWAEISRSPAAAFAIACQRHPEMPESEIASRLRRTAPWATPNPLIVRLADGLLGRQGRMIEAIAEIGRGHDAFEGTPVILTA